MIFRQDKKRGRTPQGEWFYKEMIEAALEQFDNVWIGKFCKNCGRREYCADPIT